MCKCRTNFKDFFPGLMRGLAMVVILAAVICCIVGFFFPVFKYSDPNNLVITFLGILATFVVVSNYAQMIEIRKEMKDDIEQRRMDLNVMSQKIKALTKGYGVDEIAIRELFEYKDINIRFIEKAKAFAFFVVDSENKTFFIKVSGLKENKKAEKCSPKEYLDIFKEYSEERSERKSVLINNGISPEECE